MTLSLGQFLLAAAVAVSGVAQTVPDSITLEKQVVYSNGSRLAMDIALPKSAGLHPAIIAIHGGGFKTGDRSMLLDAILHLAEHGYAAASIDYRMAPGTQFPAAVQDAKAAVKFLRANAAKYSIDPDRIGAAGHGAGGTLALLVALTPNFPEFEPGGSNREVSARVSAVAALDPLTDLGRADASLP
jgi:acetyl esterase/lipase